MAIGKKVERRTAIARRKVRDPKRSATRYSSSFLACQISFQPCGTLLERLKEKIISEGDPAIVF